MVETTSQKIPLLRKGIYSLIVLCFGLLVLLLAGEVLVRLSIKRAAIPRWFVIDPQYGYVHKKNYAEEFFYATTNVRWTARFNSFGHRAPEYDLANTNALRILLLGDSFTFGYGLDEPDIFAARLRRKFAEAELDAVVINAGVGGWGTLQEVAYARDHFALFKPDVIVLTYCDNDQVDDEAFASGLAGGLMPSFPGKRLLRDHSQLYAYLYSRMHDALHEQLLNTRQGEPPAPVEKISREEKEARRRKQEADRWERSTAILHAFHQDFLRFNPRGILILQASLPWAFYIRPHLQNLENGVTIFYMDYFRHDVAVEVSDYFLPYDPHWNPRMHERVAQSLFDKITQLRSQND